MTLQNRKIEVILHKKPRNEMVPTLICLSLVKILIRFKIFNINEAA